MANIALANVRNQIVRTLKTQGAGAQDMDATFLQAARYTVGDINSGADLETSITKPSDNNDEIALNDDFEGPFTSIVLLWMVDLGQRTAKGMEEVINRIRAEKPGMIDQIRQTILNRAVTADSDDETDFAQLGALG